METVIIVSSLVILFIITWIVIAVNGIDPLPPCCMKCLSSGCDCLKFQPHCCGHQDLTDIRLKLSANERMVWELRRDFELNQKLSSRRIFYGKSVKDQEIADNLKTMMLSTQEIAYQLGIEIK